MVQLILKKKISGKIFLAFMFWCYSNISLYGQFYTTGSAPFSVDWKQLKSDNFNIIFPAENTETAKKLADKLTKTMFSNGSWYNFTKSKPVNIILYNQNVLSNGYVTLAPKRMELITIPDQNSYAQPWIEQLALHEYRHVIQLSTLNQGFTKGLSYLFGEIAPGAMTGFLPLWYLEGDAVVAETVLSRTGRGREPDFMKEIKAIEFQRNKRFSYDQAYLGTYKYFTPDHYRYGYQMVAYAYEKFGTDVFKYTLKTVANKPYTIAPFYFGLKKKTGLSKVLLYDSSMNYLKNTWKNEQLTEKLRTYEENVQTQFKSEYVNYLYPYIDSNDTIVALRTTIDDISRFVLLKDGQEKELTIAGNFKGDQIGYSEGYIAWEELNNSLRWEQKNYSVIRIYDRKSKKSFVLKKRSRHFSPSINTNGSMLVLIDINPNNLSSIEIYDISKKERLQKFYHPDLLQLTYNCWINDTLLAIITIGEKGKSIFTLDINSGKWNKIFGPVYYNISSLQYKAKNLLFTSTADGKQNIYSLDLNTGLVIQITNVDISAKYGYLQNNKLIYSDYTINGSKLKLQIYDSLKTAPLNDSVVYCPILAEQILKIPTTDDTQKSIIQEYSITNYSRLLHAYNFHSRILPFYFDIQNISDFSEILDLNQNTYWGINLLSQNMLSTVTSSIGYYYKNGYHHFRPTIYYTGIYPKITVDMDIGGENIILSDNDSIVSILSNRNTNKKISLRVILPFDFSTSRYTLHLHPGISITYNNIYLASAYKADHIPVIDSASGIYFYRDLVRIDYSSGFYALSKMSMKDLYPKWGISLYGSILQTLRSIPYNYLWESNVFTGTAYLPGILRHHSLRARFSLENGLANRLVNNNLPRGFQNFEYNLIYQTRKSSFDYSFPVLYPDLSVGPLAYFKRIHATVFYDFMQYKAAYNLSSQTVKYNGNLYSGGVELGIETHFFRFFMPFTPVIGYSYMPQTNKSDFSFYVHSTFNF